MSTTGNRYSVVLFPSVSEALMAEKILKQCGLSFKIIPVPRHLSSDCGVCVRIAREDEGRVQDLLAGKAQCDAICAL